MIRHSLRALLECLSVEIVRCVIRLLRYCVRMKRFGTLVLLIQRVFNGLIHMI